MAQKTYSGHGILALLDTCKKHNLTSNNSKLHIKNPDDLGSGWTITVEV